MCNCVWFFSPKNCPFQKRLSLCTRSPPPSSQNRLSIACDAGWEQRRRWVLGDGGVGAGGGCWGGAAGGVKGLLSWTGGLECGDFKKHQEIHKLDPPFFFLHNEVGPCALLRVRARWHARCVTNPRPRLQWVTECGGWSLGVSHMPPDSTAIRETRKHASDTQTHVIERRACGWRHTLLFHRLIEQPGYEPTVSWSSSESGVTSLTVLWRFFFFLILVLHDRFNQVSSRFTVSMSTGNPVNYHFWSAPGVRLTKYTETFMTQKLDCLFLS